MLCEIVLGPKFKNLTFKFCFLTWRMASENVERYPKVGKTNLFKSHLFVLHQGGMSSLGLFTF